jgi:hypothetical protein
MTRTMLALSALLIAGQASAQDALSALTVAMGVLRKHDDGRLPPPPSRLTLAV